MKLLLKTQRLILRKPKKEDWKDLVEGVNNLNISKNVISIPYPYNKKAAMDFINKAMDGWNEGKTKHLFIELKSEKKLIGCISIAKINKEQGTAETGSWINEHYWKKGYMTEAKIAVNDFAFNKLNLRKLHSRVFTTNEASNATQKRLGYKLEGTLKKDVVCIVTKKIHDVYIYSLFKEDWKKNLKKLKKYMRAKLS